jgi:hypothetical protein
MVFRLSTGSGVLSGQTFSGAEIQLRKAGGALANAAGSGSVTELGSTGVYVYPATAAELDTPGLLLLRVNKSGALVWEEVHQIERAVLGSAVTGTLTTSTFTTDLASAVDDYYKDALVIFRTGNLANQYKRIGGYTGSTKLITLATGKAFTAAPANGDVFEILTR